MFHRVIDERQSAFLGGRNLLHSALIANEVVEDARKNRKKYFYSLGCITKRGMIWFVGIF